MAAVQTGQVESLIEGFCLKEYPTLQNHLSVEYERKPSDDRAYHARVRGGKVKLTFKVAPNDPEFKLWLNRAARAAQSVKHGQLVGESMLSDGLAGRRSREA